MKNFRNILFATLPVFAVLFTACSSDDDIVNAGNSSVTPSPSEGTMSFSANMESDNTTTRTKFNDNNTLWSASDKIFVLNKASVASPGGRDFSGEFELVDGENTKEGLFTGNPIAANSGENSNEFYSVYPSGTISSDLKISGTIPAVQTVESDGYYNQSLHYMTAYSTNSDLNFKNVCALIKITISGNNGEGAYFNLSRIKVVSNLNRAVDNSNKGRVSYTKGANIVGNFTATISTDGTSAVTISESGASPFVELRGANNCTSRIPNGTYYLVVLPSQISSGFTLLLEDVQGNKAYQRVSTKITKFERNKMYDLGKYDVSAFTAGNTLADVVDLGLPSGTLWCLNDVPDADADNSETKGFFAWGETQTKNKNYYSWDYSVLPSYQRYVFGRGELGLRSYYFRNFLNNGTLGKYYDEYRGNFGNWNLTGATYDSRFELEDEDDVVTKRTGASFCLPTQYQIQELVDHSSDPSYNSNIYTISGKDDYVGRTITFKDGGYMGYKGNSSSWTTSFGAKDSGMARYWSKTRCNGNDCYMAFELQLNGATKTIVSSERAEGRRARGVVKR